MSEDVDGVFVFVGAGGVGWELLMMLVKFLDISVCFNRCTDALGVIFRSSCSSSFAVNSVWSAGDSVGMVQWVGNERTVLEILME